MHFASLYLLALSAAPALFALPTTRFSSTAQRRAQIARLQMLHRRASLVAVAPVATTGPSDPVLPPAHNMTEAEAYALEVATIHASQPSAMAVTLADGGARLDASLVPAVGSSLPRAGSESETGASQAYDVAVGALPEHANSSVTAYNRLARIELLPAFAAAVLPAIGSESDAEARGVYEQAVDALPEHRTSFRSGAARIAVAGAASGSPIGFARRALPTADVAFTTNIPAAIATVPVPTSGGIGSGASFDGNLTALVGESAPAKVARGKGAASVEAVNLKPSRRGQLNSAPAL